MTTFHSPFVTVHTKLAPQECTRLIYSIFSAVFKVARQEPYFTKNAYCV
jgi:hypothetical protein